MGKVYFGRPTEKAVRCYIKETDYFKKQAIYLTQIQPAFEKLVECILRMKKFDFSKLGNYQSLHNEVMAHLYSTLEKFNPRRLSKKTRKRVKAFSYFGTVAKNYLVQQSIKRSKTDYLHEDREGNEIDISTLKLTSTDSFIEEFEENQFIKLLVDHFESRFEKLSPNHQKVCDAILYFLKNSKKETIFNKKHLYIILREWTGLPVKQITACLHDFQKEYQKIRNDFNNGKI